MGTLPQVIRLAASTDPMESDIPAHIQPGARIHVSDRWPRDESVINYLRVIHARLVKAHGHGLVDPTGLLGVESSTTQTPDTIAARQVTDGVPVGANLKNGTFQRHPSRPRASQPTRYRGHD